jgi:5,10-methylenetetrahydromethanopterin reductase
MRISIMGDPWMATFADHVEEAAFAASIGAETYWLAQVWRYDAMTMISALAAATPGDLRFGTGVVATYHRHPMAMATQALTTSLLTGGRFTLGIGLMHQPLIEGMFEIPFDRPVRHMSEYLSVLLPLLDQQPADVHGEFWSYHGTVGVPGASAPPVIVAALGPQMLRLCGARTAGTITWMTGPETLRSHVVPTITEAAERAGRPAPRVVAMVALRVTDDVAAARRDAVGELGGYGNVPSYRAMLDREGIAGAEDFAIIGPEDDAREQLARYDQPGVTEIGVLLIGGAAARDRTRNFLATIQ